MNPKIICFTLGASLLIGMPTVSATPAPHRAAHNATPATPATAATPATPATPAHRATPATPAKPATPAHAATKMAMGKVMMSSDNMLVISVNGKTDTLTVTSTTKYKQAGKDMTAADVKSGDMVKVHYEVTKSGMYTTMNAMNVEIMPAKPMHPVHPMHPAHPAKTPAAH